IFVKVYAPGDLFAYDRSMDNETFLQRLLEIMERKDHWAWPRFTSGEVAKERLHIHLEQEWEVYVRDFPVMIGWAYVQCPIPAARRALIENAYEEETGGLVAGRPHPELFLEYPRGLGFDLARFSMVKLLPAARAYRDWLDEATQRRGWEVACAVSTIFVEGTKYERGEVDASAAKRPVTPLSEHPLVKHYGLPLEHLELTKAHRKVEGEHRREAWDLMTDHVADETRADVLAAMEQTLTLWLAYRDDVAAACGLQ
ncbi:MAG: iron-containing redox enzyme family protein, partial [Myxococcota bacterium]